MTKFQDKSFSTYAPVNEEYSDNWERTFRRRTSEAQCTCALYPGPLGECPVHHSYSQHTCHEGSVCRATRGGCVLRTQHCNVFSGDHHYCMVADGEDCCCTCDGCNAAFVRAADPCQDAYDAGYARGREMGTREGFAEGQASMEQRGEAAPPCTKTSGMGSAGMTSQVGPAPDTNTTPAGGPGEAGTNLRASADPPVCEHTEPWNRGCPNCDPRCEHGVAKEFACSKCVAECDSPGGHLHCTHRASAGR